ncbi:MAG: hypothetical protein ACFCU9_14220 [Cyanophyceae cyanobacterium]
MSLTPYRPPSSEGLVSAPTPQWVWIACVPVVGAAAIAFAGYRANLKSWMIGGSLAFGVSFLAAGVSSLGPLISLMWLGQIGFAWFNRQEFLLRTSPKGSVKPRDAKTSARLAKIYGPSDINNISKDEMVGFLGIPIVYANVIEEFQREGFAFADLEELKDVAGIPGQYIDHLAPILSYGVRYQQTLNTSWHRLNTLSSHDLVVCGLEPEVAQKICHERALKGTFNSVLDVKARTGIPINALRNII